MTMETIKDRLINITAEGNVHEAASMAEYTSFKAGGCADLLVEPQTAMQLQEILKMLNEEQCQYMVIGNGSNILCKDGGYRGVIVRLGEAFNYIEQDGCKLICGAGTLMSTIARRAASLSLSGFEFASGIPGSIGGAVFMNAGAYGGETADILDNVALISADGSKVFNMTAEELDMGYRHTLLHETGDIVVEVTLKFKEGKEEEIRQLMSELTEKRNSKQPVQYPSAGSFFKRPEGYFAGKLIQDAGCKGLSVGGAEVSTKHSGFIINKGGATATDIIRLMEIVQACVFEMEGVKLEPEVRIIGEDIEGPEDTRKKHRESKDNDFYTEIKKRLNPDYEIFYDLHTHTTYSHGKGSVESNVREALDKKLEFVAISDHGPGHLFYGVNRNDFVNLRNDIDKMNVKYQNINVKLSVEANIIIGGNGLDIRPEEFEEFDFVIAGFHFGMFKCNSVRNWLWSHGIKIGEESLRQANTDMVVNALKSNNIAILTHPGDKGPFDIKKIAEVCAETDTLMEINNRHGHLDVEELKIAAQVEGVKFIISSDAHVSSDVGCYEEALRRATEAEIDLSRIVNIREKK